MLIKKTNYIIILLFLAQIVYSQNEKDEIILNSGKSIKGKIIAQKPGEYIKVVQFFVTDTIIIKMEDIDEMKKIDQQVEPNFEILVPTNKLLNSQNDSISLKLMPKHYLSFYALGSLGNNEVGGIISLGLGLSFHRNISKYFQYGFSAGAYFNYNISFLPFTLDSKLRLEEVKHQSLNYFFKTSIGYSSLIVKNSFYYEKTKTTNNLTDGGLLLKLAVGVDKINKRSKINSIEFGFLLQQFYHRDYLKSFPVVNSANGRFYLQTSFSF
ncbi:MAG: hypothetical protein IPO48_01325 [Saprospiraceae bacterium]|nr:hypothetical protein [Saprospiraceae bacterium]